MRWFAFACLLLVACARSPEPESWLVPSDLEELSKIDAEGAEALKQGDLARRRGDVEGALELFRRAQERLPAREMPMRFACLLQTERGRQAEAQSACDQAVGRESHAPAARRALVGAMMASQVPPTPSELGEARLLTRALLDNSRQDPYGHAAMCDIARRLGDDEMLMASLSTLKRLAPDHYETRRLERLLAHRTPGFAFYAGWIALGALALGTLAHALSRFRTRWPLLRARAASATLFGVLALAPVARAEEPAAPPAPEASPAAEPVLSYGLSEWGINDQDPESSLPAMSQMNENPLQAGYHLMDLAEKGEKARKAGQHALAVKYYRALYKMVPDRAVALGKLCESYEALGQYDNALKACIGAIFKQGVQIEDYLRFSRLSLRGDAPLVPEAIRNLDNVVTHLAGQPEPAAHVAAARIQCDLGFRLSDPERLSACTNTLAKLAPHEHSTISYQWTLALIKQDYSAANRLISRAREAGVAPDVLEKMHLVTSASQPVWRQVLTDWRTLIVLAAAATLLGGSLVVFRRRLEAGHAAA